MVWYDGLDPVVSVRGMMVQYRSLGLMVGGLCFFGAFFFGGSVLLARATPFFACGLKLDCY